MVMIHKCTGATRDELLSQIGDKQQDKRQWAENDAQEVLAKYEEVYCADDQSNVRDCSESFRVFVTGVILESLMVLLESASLI